MQAQSSLNGYIHQALVQCADRQAFTDIGSDSFTFGQVAEHIARLHIGFELVGLKPGDKVAFCGKNNSRWIMAWLASVTYGLVAVPILHEFSTDSVHHLVDHSDAKVLFADPAIWRKLTAACMPKLAAAVSLEDYTTLYAADGKTREQLEQVGARFDSCYPSGFSPSLLKVYDGRADEVAVINYTSGSTGTSKGVVLTYGNLWSNIQYCIDGLTYLLPGDGMVSMLPLAHMFGLMIETVHPFVKGCHVHFITRVPSPAIVLKAFATVRPKLIITVPLVLEKIIRSRVQPELEKPRMKRLLSIPVVRSLVLRAVKGKLIKAFGGNLRQIIIGGAALNPDVEILLRSMRFPVTVGYGMTECGPLIAYAPWDQNPSGASGRCTDRMEARVDSPDPVNVPGVLWVRGANVMKEYYKNPQATADVMGDDGWMSTGDICTIDPKGFIFIRGRDKNMILGPSGQNIYPEEIENVINNLPLVAESIVIADPDLGGRLVALIHPDMDAAQQQGMDMTAVEAALRDNIKEVNAKASPYNRVSDIRIHPEPFEKTPKHSIKRYLYQK